MWPWTGTKVVPEPVGIPKKYIQAALSQMIAQGMVVETRDANGNRTPDEDIVDGDELMRRAKELMEKKGGRKGRYTRRRTRRRR